MSGDGVAAIHHHLARFGQLQGVAEPADVVDADGGGPLAAVAMAQVAGFDAAAQVADDFAVQGDLVDDDLQTVVLRRVMAAGDHHAGMAGAERVGGVVQQRRRNRAEIQHVQSGGADTGLERIAQRGAGQPSVATDDHLGFAPFGGEAADRLADVAYHLRGQVAVYHAANVVFPKDGLLHAGFNAARNGQSHRLHARWA